MGKSYFDNIPAIDAKALNNSLGVDVNVKHFGAKGDGVTDDTAAFNSAIATGRKVFVPITTIGYLVDNIAVIDNMVIEGEKNGISLAPILIVKNNNGSAFLQSGDNKFHVSLSNLACKANDGITGASFFKQADKTKYSAYTEFKNIETYKNLQVSYDGFFIFTTWNKCRDGYLGIGYDHTAIKNNAESYVQINKTNINTARDCRFFGSIGANAAIEMYNGTLFVFEKCDFENLQVPVFTGRAANSIQFTECWFESIDADRVIDLSEGVGTSAGSNAIFSRCVFFVDAPVQWIAHTDPYSYVSFRDNVFNITAVTTVLSNNPLAVRISENNVASGDGASFILVGMHNDSYFGGKRFLNGCSDNNSGSNIQNAGKMSADGFTSSYGKTVSTEWGIVASANFTGGLCLINGYADGSGAPGVWLVLFGAVPVVISSNDYTGTTPLFQVVGGVLQMKTTTGSLVVATSLLV